MHRVIDMLSKAGIYFEYNYSGMKTFFFTILAPLTFSSFLVPNVFAQSEPPCGNIIAPADWRIWQDRSRPIQSAPIDDCEDPFLKTDALVGLKISGLDVTNAAVLEIPEGGTSDYRYGAESAINESSVFYFRHTEDNYQYVDTSYKEPTAEQFEQAALNFFGNQSDADRYLVIYRSNDPYEYFYDEANEQYEIDETTGETIEYRYFKFVDYLIENLVTDRPKLTAGTYTAVTVYVVPILSYEENIFKKILARVIPIAHAQYIVPDEVSVVTFTLTEGVPEPEGASSVLFLPGIQASRLYLGDGVQVSDKLWEPGNNTDVRLLSMDINGTSNLDIRTNDVIDEVGTSILGLGSNVYKGFISFMDALVEDSQVIKKWTPFAYDWRNDVFHIVKNGTKYRDGSIRNPVDEVMNLAADSFSKKVTIVAHSNGGLLAKAIMIELERRGKQNLVDKIIFIGTPQLGTPKAIATILHGYDQEALGGLIIDDGVAREVIKNLPGTYSLLPSERYLQNISDSLVEFDNSETTASLRSSYGTSINDIAELNAFMAGLEDSVGRSRVDVSEVNKPTNVNSKLYLNAQINHKLKLDNWSPASTTKVYQIAGTGLPTMKSLRYREIIENTCRDGINSQIGCLKAKIMKPQAVMTAYGDETVVSKSAEFSATNSVSIYYFDLFSVKQGLFNLKKSHTDLTEASQIQDFVKNVLTTGSSTNIRFISDSQPVFSKAYDIEEINSPVKISAKDIEGRVTGIVREGNQWIQKNEIPNSSYFEFGGTKYLVIPTDTDRTTTLLGEASGGYTLTISELSGTDLQVIKHEVVNATTTINMVASYTKKDSKFSTIKSDYNNDGIVDQENTVDGTLVIPPPLYTYQSLKSTITLLPIKKIQKDALLLLANQAEQLNKNTTNPIFIKLKTLTFRVLESTVILYQNRKILTGPQANDLLKIIRFLNK